MELNYKVRFKKSFKIKVFCGGLILTMLVFGAFWALVKSPLFKQKDVIEWKNYVSLKPQFCRFYGKYHVFKCSFKIRHDVDFLVDFKSKPNQGEEYCIGEIHRNGKFQDYAVVPQIHCQ